MTTLKEIAKETRKQLKAEFPEYKFSVTTEYFSGGKALNISLMSGPKNPFASKYTYVPRDGRYKMENDHAQLNHKYIEHYQERYCERTGEDIPAGWYSNGHHLTAEAAKMLKRAAKIANTHNWDHSDIQVDYFDVNYYFSLDIGKWNKPFEIKASK